MIYLLLVDLIYFNLKGEAPLKEATPLIILYLFTPSPIIHLVGPENIDNLLKKFHIFSIVFS